MNVAVLECVSEDIICSEDLDLWNVVILYLGESFDRSLPDRNNACEEFDHLDGVVTLTVKKVEAVFDFLYGDSVLLGGVFEDELFNEEEGSFVRDFLSDLD